MPLNETSPDLPKGEEGLAHEVLLLTFNPDGTSPPWEGLGEVPMESLPIV